MHYALKHCECTEIFEPEHVYKFSGECLVTRKPYSVTVPASGLFKYHRGAYIQEAFPDLSSDDREFLISGTSPEGWKQLYGDEDEED